MCKHKYLMTKLRPYVYNFAFNPQSLHDANHQQVTLTKVHIKKFLLIVVKIFEV